MRRALAFLGLSLLLATLLAAGPAQQPDNAGGSRLYPGAPPVIPHPAGEEMNACLDCHGTADSGAPQTPHPTRFRCRQCHVAVEQPAEFRSSDFAPLPKLPLPPRMHDYAPPVIPHSVLLREDCLACHAPGARAGIVSTPHPERARCQQCHVTTRPYSGAFPP
jgi:cytochrome c-type protein NapB